MCHWRMTTLLQAKNPRGLVLLFFLWGGSTHYFANANSHANCRFSLLFWGEGALPITSQMQIPMQIVVSPLGHFARSPCIHTHQGKHDRKNKTGRQNRPSKQAAKTGRQNRPPKQATKKGRQNKTPRHHWRRDETWPVSAPYFSTRWGCLCTSIEPPKRASKKGHQNRPPKQANKTGRQNRPPKQAALGLPGVREPVALPFPLYYSLPSQVFFLTGEPLKCLPRPMKVPIGMALEGWGTLETYDTLAHR